MRNKNRDSYAVPQIALVLVLGVIAQGCSFTPQTANAQAVLTKAFGLLETDVNNLDRDSFMKHERTIFTRNSPASLRSDPYHREPTDTVIETNWVAGGGISRFEQRDSVTGQLIAVIIRTEVEMKIRDFVLGTDRVIDLGSNSVRQRSPISPLQGAIDEHIESIATSEWQQPAWLITATKEVTTGGAELTPAYIADLTIDKLENRWVVDKATNRLVKSERLAVTQAGEEIVLERSVASPVTKGKVSDLPVEWFDTKSDVVSDSPVDQYPVAPTVNRQPSKGADTINLLQPSDSSFSLIQEIEDATDNYATQADGVGVIFRIRQAGQRGNAVERVYKGPSKEAVFTLIQGPSSQLVPAMRKTTPIYLRSSLQIVRIGDRDVNVWIASGGGLDQSPKQVVAMFEHESKFVYIAAQNASETELRTFLSSLTSGAQ
jgi:hypothetical protein